MLRLINIRATYKPKKVGMIFLDCFLTDLGFKWQKWGVFMGRRKKSAHEVAITETPSIKALYKLEY